MKISSLNAGKKLESRQVAEREREREKIREREKGFSGWNRTSVRELGFSL